MPSVSCPSGGEGDKTQSLTHQSNPAGHRQRGFSLPSKPPCKTKGTSPSGLGVAARFFSPLGGRWPEGSDEGAPSPYISPPLPPHPAAATFSPSGRRRHAAPLANQSPQTTANGALLSPHPPCATGRRRDGKVMASTPAITQTSPTHMADVGTSPRNTMPMATPIGTLR